MSTPSIRAKLLVCIILKLWLSKTVSGKGLTCSRACKIDENDHEITANKGVKSNSSILLAVNTTDVQLSRLYDISCIKSSRGEFVWNLQSDINGLKRLGVVKILVNCTVLTNDESENFNIFANATHSVMTVRNLHLSLNNTTAEYVDVLSQEKKQIQIYLFYCDRPANENLSVRFDGNATYRTNSNFYCKRPDAELYYENKKAENHTYCNSNAHWHMENQIQCWYAPAVNLSQKTFYEGEILKLACVATGGYPTRSYLNMSFNGSNTQSITEMQSYGYLSSSYHGMKAWCKAITNYTMNNNKGEDELNITVYFGVENVIDKSYVQLKDASYFTLEVDIEFRSNPTLKKENFTFSTDINFTTESLLNITDHKLETRTAVDQTYTAQISNINSTDGIKYFLRILYTFNGSTYNKTIEINRTLQEQTSTSEGEGQNYLIIIVSVSGAAVLILILLGIGCFINKRCKESKDEGRNQKEVINPIYGSSLHTTKDTDDVKKGTTIKKESNEREERVNPIYQSTSASGIVEEAYAEVNKKITKKEKAKSKTGEGNVAFTNNGEVLYAVVDKKGKTDEPSTSAQGNSFQVQDTYAEVKKKEKKKKDDSDNEDDDLHGSSKDE